MNYLIRILVFSVFFFPQLFTQNFLLKSPACIAPEQVDQLPRFWDAEFGDRAKASARFIYYNDKAAVKLYTNNNGTYSSLLWVDLEKKILEFIPSQESNYYIDTPKLFHFIQKPKQLDVKTAAELIATKNVLFYTGAGISLAGNVDDMGRLIRGLAIPCDVTFKTEYPDYLKAHEQEILTYFTNFCHQASTAQPTNAHQALAHLAQQLHTQIMTENFDFLQQRAGVMPYCITAESLSKNVTPQDLQAIDAVICIGLSHDDRGFLGWYKRHNPDGIIIAFDISTPEYLGDEDFLVNGDAQHTIEQLRDCIVMKKEELHAV